MGKATLIDTTKCLGCRSCQVACKQWNELEAEKTSLDGKRTFLQNPSAYSSHTFNVMTFNEVPDDKAPGGLKFVMAKRQCMHCEQPSCASACPVTALHKTPEGPVLYEVDKCIGCRYCVWACPFGVPTAEWDSLAPQIHKCTLCSDRSAEPLPTERNGQPLTEDNQQRFTAAHQVPACVNACPTGALQFGERDALLAEARERMVAHPGRYVDHIYGEHEVGGTSYLYLAAVPFEKLGFRADLGTTPYPAYTATALGLVPAAVLGVGAALGGIHLFARRKAAVAREEAERKLGETP
jgi:formate dehydrogenase iron-sulfur subunit